MKERPLNGPVCLGHRDYLGCGILMAKALAVLGRAGQREWGSESASCQMSSSHHEVLVTTQHISTELKGSWKSLRRTSTLLELELGVTQAATSNTSIEHWLLSKCENASWGLISSLSIHSSLMRYFTSWRLFLYMLKGGQLLTHRLSISFSILPHYIFLARAGSCLILQGNSPADKVWWNSVVLKVWALHQQHHLRTVGNANFSSPARDLANQGLWGWGQTICCTDLRTIGIIKTTWGLRSAEPSWILLLPLGRGSHQPHLWTFWVLVPFPLIRDSIISQFYLGWVQIEERWENAL